MRIIETITEQFTQCPFCNTKIGYFETDLNQFNNLKCPICCREFRPDWEEPTENFIFPKTFYKFGEEEYSKKLSNAEIQQYVDEVRNAEPNLKAGKWVFAGSGDTIVIGLKMEEEFEIIVAQNYYSDSMYYD